MPTHNITHSTGEGKEKSPVEDESGVEVLRC
jgi:hypothetical protein